MGKTYRNYPDWLELNDGRFNRGSDGFNLQPKHSGRDVPGYADELYTKKQLKKLRKKRRRQREMKVDYD